MFSEFLAQCGRGLTPNPDLACNRHIKFDALLAFADTLGAELGGWELSMLPACGCHVCPSALPACADRLGAGRGGGRCGMRVGVWLSFGTCCCLSPASHSSCKLSTCLAAVATGHYARLAPPDGGSSCAASSASAGAGSGAAGAPAGAAAAPATAAAGGAGVPRLLRGLDHQKDQTYFLASVQPAALRRVLFPVGHLPVSVVCSTSDLCR